MAACQNGKLVAPLTFAGTCNTEVVDAYFAQVLLPVLPPGSVIVLDKRPVPSVADHGGAGHCGRLCAIVSAGLLARPQSHRTTVGRRQNPPSPRPAHRRQPCPFCRHNLPMLLLNAI